MATFLLAHHIRNPVQFNLTGTAKTFDMAGLEKRKGDDASLHDRELQLQVLETMPRSKDNNTAATIKALDLDVKTFIELKNFPAARRDAISILRRNRTDATRLSGLRKSSDLPETYLPLYSGTSMACGGFQRQSFATQTWERSYGTPLSRVDQQIP